MSHPNQCKPWTPPKVDEPTRCRGTKADGSRCGRFRDVPIDNGYCHAHQGQAK